jgi:hypothetical protein
MLFMVIEDFKKGKIAQLELRFKKRGRMLPDGVVYHASWIDAGNLRCYQVMESPSRELMKTWMSRWDDLVNFEIIPVVNSAEFWEARRSGKRRDTAG